MEDNSQEEVRRESASKKQRLDVAAELEQSEQEQVLVKEEQLEQEMDEEDEDEEDEEDENEDLAKNMGCHPCLLAMSHSSPDTYQPSSSQK